MSIIKSFLNQIDRKLSIHLVCVLLPFILIPLAISEQQHLKCSYVLILVSSYWILEPIPLPVTGLLPVVLFPLLGVTSSGEICLNYMKEIMVMFLGGILMAIAVEECNLHERIALKIVLMIGTKVKWIFLGIMLSTCLLSMWLSNIATTAVMIPIVEALLKIINSSNIQKNSINEKIEKDSPNSTLMQCRDGLDPEEQSLDKKKINKNERTVYNTFLLSICYAANIGGTGTLSGTAANWGLKGLVDEFYPESNDITYASWMMYNIPSMILCLLLSWFYLYVVYIRPSRSASDSNEKVYNSLVERYNKLGSMTIYEIEVLILFIILILLWFFRDPKFITGWAEMTGSNKKIGDSAPAIAIAVLLFFLPSDIRNIKSRPILDWKQAQLKFPWSILLICGGGFALADGVKKSGLSAIIADHLNFFEALNPVLMVAVVCLFTATVTEILTNVTTTLILCPIFNQLAVSFGINPLFLMLPIAVSSAYSFMLPVATLCNALVYEVGHMKTMDMVKPGFLMNIICCIVQTFMINTLGNYMFGFDKFPSWANTSETAIYEKFAQNEAVFNSSFIL